MSAITEPGKVHLGRNIKRIREILKVKQQTLATQLGDDWSQKKISQLEDKDVIDDALLGEVAKALNVPVEAIKEFDDENTVNIVSNNTFENCDLPASIFFNSHVNPVDKWVKAIDEIKSLYERLLQSEKEKVELLKQMMENLK
jgi:transcriptional regulator with XRE-family HTH domain